MKPAPGERWRGVAGRAACPGAALLVWFCAACASTQPRARPAVDLRPAQESVDGARGGSAARLAPHMLAEAETSLAQAVELTREDDTESLWRAQCLADVSVAQARCAQQLADARTPPAAPEGESGRDAEEAALRTRLARAESEARRLLERVGLLSRELELAEDEVVRSKARLRGGVTKAEAAAAIAEARVLARRLDERAGYSETQARVTTALERADEQLGADNHAAAIFFALRAQELAQAALATGATARPVLAVRAARANVRDGPGLEHAVVGQLSRGASVQSLASQGDWVRVRAAEIEGWVHRSLLE